MSWSTNAGSHRVLGPLLVSGLLALTLTAAPDEGPPSVMLQACVSEGATTWLSVRPAATSASRWVRIGDEFDGIAVWAWNEKTRTVTLAQNERRWQVALAESASIGAGENLALDAKPALMTELVALAARACERFLEQPGGQLSVRDLVGPEQPLFRLEQLTAEEATDVSFRLGARGPEIVMGETVRPLLGGTDTIAVRVAPGQTLAAVAQRLRVPLARLEALNPDLVGGRVPEWRTLRIQ